MKVRNAKKARPWPAQTGVPKIPCERNDNGNSLSKNKGYGYGYSHDNEKRNKTGRVSPRTRPRGGFRADRFTFSNGVFLRPPVGYARRNPGKLRKSDLTFPALRLQRAGEGKTRPENSTNYYTRFPSACQPHRTEKIRKGKRCPPPAPFTRLLIRGGNPPPAFFIRFPTRGENPLPALL